MMFCSVQVQIHHKCVRSFKFRLNTSLQPTNNNLLNVFIELLYISFFFLLKQNTKKPWIQIKN